MAMKKFLTSTLVGAFLGALEGGVIFGAVLIRESGDGFVIGGVGDWIILIFIMGLIYGGIAGAIIGVLVALLNARGSIGLAVGIAVGLVAAEVLVMSTLSLDVIAVLVAITTILGGGSIGLVTALLTFRAKDLYRSTGTS